MGEGGRTCRKVDRGGKLAGDESFDVEVSTDDVRISVRGRVVRTLVGTDADAVRAAITSGDEATLQRLVARATGHAKSGKRGDPR